MKNIRVFKKNEIQHKTGNKFFISICQHEENDEGTLELTSRATLKSDIPTKLINENSDIFSEFLYENFNNIVENENFPIELKWADVNRYIKKIIELNLKVKMNFRPDIRQMFFSEKNHDIKSYYTL